MLRCTKQFKTIWEILRGFNFRTVGSKFGNPGILLILLKNNSWSVGSISRGIEIFISKTVKDKSNLIGTVDLKQLTSRNQNFQTRIFLNIEITQPSQSYHTKFNIPSYCLTQNNIPIKKFKTLDISNRFRVTRDLRRQCPNFETMFSIKKNGLIKNINCSLKIHTG